MVMGEPFGRLSQSLGFLGDTGLGQNTPKSSVFRVIKPGNIYLSENISLPSTWEHMYSHG